MIGFDDLVAVSALTLCRFCDGPFVSFVVLVSGVPVDFSVESAWLGGVVSARFRRFWVLKSVSYQPFPFRRNPTGEITLVRPEELQLGQISGSGSDIFCRRSSR